MCACVRVRAFVCVTVCVCVCVYVYVYVQLWRNLLSSLLFIYFLYYIAVAAVVVDRIILKRTYGGAVLCEGCKLTTTRSLKKHIYTDGHCKENKLTQSKGQQYQAQKGLKQG